ncbi:hypothetical protein [Pseudovibrio sp. Tun.PSC04-5.I4]|nr:hypothetical protein [Pseudovibrio sp. Tun.PSC04-5.I4]
MPKRSACLIKSVSARGTGSLAARTAPRASHASVAREAAFERFLFFVA